MWLPDRLGGGLHSDLRRPVGLVLIFTLNHLYLRRGTGVCARSRKSANAWHTRLTTRWRRVSPVSVFNCRPSATACPAIEGSGTPGGPGHSDGADQPFGGAPQYRQSSSGIARQRRASPCPSRVRRTHGQERETSQWRPMVRMPAAVCLSYQRHLFRIGQEAIANSIRHADPDTIRIRLLRTRASICLSVEDDGEGFIADSAHAGFGLSGNAQEGGEYFGYAGRQEHARAPVPGWK